MKVESDEPMVVSTIETDVCPACKIGRHELCEGTTTMNSEGEKPKPCMCADRDNHPDR